MGLILPTVRTRQPQQAPQIDWSNLITRGLQFSQVGSGNGPFSNINSVGVVATPSGVAKKFISASSQYLSAPNGAISPTSLTFIVVGSVNSATANSALISIGAASNDRVLLYVSSAGGLAIFSGQGVSSAQATLAGNVTAGQTYVFGGRVNGANFRDNWINGVQQSSDATAVTPAACSTLAVGAYYTSGVPTAGFYLDGSVTLALVWNRPLSDAEMRSVAANPWQLFRSTQRVMLASGAGPVNATGTLASTLGNATLAASGIALNAGAFASTMGNATMTAAGSVGAAPSGTMASTLADATMSAAGAATNAGSFATSLAGASMSAAGIVINRGTFSATMSDATMAAAGTVAPNATGTFHSTLDGASMAAYGYNGVPPVLAGFFHRLPKNPRHVQRIP